MPQTNIGTTPTRLFNRSPYRRSVYFHNKSANIIYIDTGEAGGLTTANAGIILPAGSSRWYNWWEDGEREMTDAWSAIADGADSTLVYKEFSGTIKTVELVEKLQAAEVKP